MSWTILIPDRISEVGEPEQTVFGQDAEWITPSATEASDIPNKDWKRADAILAWHDLEYDHELIERLDNCKILVRVGVGYDNVDLGAAADAGIPVCNVPDYGTNDVADHTMALMLSLWRGIPYYNERAKNSNQGWKWESDISMRRLNNARLAIIGFGRIGTAVAHRARGFGMDTVVYDPYLPDGYEKSVAVERVRDLKEALRNADIVTIHTPLTAETEMMVDQSFLSVMNDDSVLINTARGRLVSLDALYDVLRNGTLRAAGLDVLEQEPPESDHPLIKAWRQQPSWIQGRLTITPHAAFYCDEALTEMREKAARTAYVYLNTNQLWNCVNESEFKKTNIF